MRKRTGDWRDLLSAYALALDSKKVYVGFLATLYTVAVMVAATIAYAEFHALGLVARDGYSPALVALGDPQGPGALLWHFVRGTGLQMLGTFLPLLNPLYDGSLGHFVLSALVYVALFWAWSAPGGVVSRLTALEYARDDMPLLHEARAMVRSRRSAYFLAPMMPFIVILFLSVLNLLGGLIASCPLYIGRILLIFPGLPLLLASTVVIVFLIVFGVLSFGLMTPAVSVGGKDAFESWSTAYSYVLWGLRRFICYTLLAGVIGAVASVVAWALAELLIYCIHQTVDIGYISATPWMAYFAGVTDGRFGVTLGPASGGLEAVLSGVVVVFMVALRALPAAYAFSYFFTANTIIFFLMRKDQDNIEVDEVYEEPAEEEGEVAGEAAEQPAAEQKEQPAKAPGEGTAAAGGPRPPEGISE